MIIPDINLLVYAYNEDAPLHKPAKTWWKETPNDFQTVAGLPCAVTLGFIRIMTHPKILLTPLYPAEAIHHTRVWLARSNVEILSPGERHLPINPIAFIDTLKIRYRCMKGRSIIDGPLPEEPSTSLLLYLRQSDHRVYE